MCVWKTSWLDAIYTIVNHYLLSAITLENKTHQITHRLHSIKASSLSLSSKNESFMDQYIKYQGFQHFGFCVLQQQRTMETTTATCSMATMVTEFLYVSALEIVSILRIRTIYFANKIFAHTHTHCCNRTVCNCMWRCEFGVLFVIRRLYTVILCMTHSCSAIV